MRLFSLLITVIAMFAVGCGGARQQVSPEPNSTPENPLSQKWAEAGGPGKLLKPLILHSRATEKEDADEENRSIPELGKDLGFSEDDWIISEDSLAYKKTILLFDRKNPDKKSAPEYFLVWEEKVLGVPIVNAYYQHEKTDVTNKKYGRDERKNVYQDKAHQRWFIPLSEIAGGPIENVDPSDFHWCILELHLAEGTVLNLKVGFHLVGPLPQVKTMRTAVERAPDYHSIGSRLSSGGGWIVASDTYTNPSGKNLILWVKGGGEELRLTTFPRLNSPEHFELTADGKDMIFPPVYHYYFSKAELILDLVVTKISENGNSERIEVRLSDQFIKINLGPNEKTVLEWRIRTQAPRCSLPGPYDVKITGMMPFPLPYHPDHKAEARTSTKANWDLIGMNLEGNISRSVTVTDTHMNADGSLLFPQRKAVLLEDKKSMQSQDGSIPSGASAYECQGIFP